MHETITVKEAAELTGCSERAIRKRIAQGALPAELTGSPAGGRRYMIPVSALEPVLQHKYYLRRYGELPEWMRTVKEPASPPKRLRSIDEFSAGEREEIERWIHILNQWQRFREQYPGSCAAADREYIRRAQQEHGSHVRLSAGILYRRQAAWQAGDLDGLVDSRGKWKKGTTSIPQEIQDLFMYMYLDEHALPVAKCAEATRLFINQECPELARLMPERDDPFYRLVKQCPVPVATLARQGDKAFNDRCGVYVNRLYDDMQSNDYWVADGHTIDVISQSENGSEIRHRLTLSAFIDARSGIYVGWVVTKNPSSDATLLALRKAILRYGIPRHIYVDNGREYLNTDIGGLGHRTRKRKVEIKLPTPILARLGITMTNALPRNGQAKIIEREFRNFTFLSSLFDTYTGRSPENRPEKLKYNLKAGMIPTDGELTQIVEDMLEGYYNLLPYNGKVAADRGKNRMEVYETRLIARRQASADDLHLMMLRSTRLQKVKRNGVHLTIGGERIFYGNDELQMMQDREVFLRYNPENMDKVRVYDKNEAYPNLIHVFGIIPQKTWIRLGYTTRTRHTS